MKLYEETKTINEEGKNLINSLIAKAIEDQGVDRLDSIEFEAISKSIRLAYRLMDLAEKQALVIDEMNEKLDKILINQKKV